MYAGNLLKHLRAFIHTAQLGSVSLAAERLYLSQPSISQQLKALERGLGQTLFDRHGPKLRLTPAGKALLDLATPLVERIDRLPEVFQRQYGSLESGEIRIAAGESTMLHLLPSLIMRFRQQHPGIAVSLNNVTGIDGLGMIRRGEVDFAVGSMLDVPDDIDYQAIYQFKPVLIMSPDHPLARRAKVTLADISPHGLILPPRRLTTFQMVDLVFQRHGLPYRVTMEVAGWEVIKRYVAAGLGLSITTQLCIDPRDHDRLVSRDLSNDFPSRSYGVVMRRGGYLSPASQRFVDLMSPELFGEA